MSEITIDIGADHVTTVVIDKPPNNHVSVGLMRRLADEMEKLDEDKRVRVILLASAGKNFCAGADLNEPRGLVSEDAPQGISQLYVEAVRLFSIKKPIVAAVQGAAVGAGLGLALVADHRVAATDARFAANFTKLGFHPGFGLTHTLPRLIGAARASLMFLTSRRFKAEEALEMGLCDAIAAPEDVRATAHALAAEIAENAPLAIVATRATLRAELAAAVKAQTDIEHREQTWLRATKDFAEGVRSVSERRVGNFTGE